MRAKQLLMHMHHMNAMKGHDLCGFVPGCSMPSHSPASCNAQAISRGPSMVSLLTTLMAGLTCCWCSCHCWPCSGHPRCHASASERPSRH